ncbi:hypothetical protein BT93_J0580 [Corymbia citriodora subsp. variegata]|nr:hypothetical protein BT93_J0580 [Corymbia citriodora subsp. variegata]
MASNVGFDAVQSAFWINSQGKRLGGRPRNCPVGSRKTYPNSQDKQNLEIKLNKLEKIKEEEEKVDLRAVATSSKPRKHKQKKKPGKLAAGLPLSKSRFWCPSIEKNTSRSEVNARLKAVEETFTSKFAYFMTNMKMFCIEKLKMQYIPRAFDRVDFPWERADIVLRFVCVINKNRHFFSGGWPAFIQDNKLGTIDVCVFELLSNKEFRVTIFRWPETLTA